MLGHAALITAARGVAPLLLLDEPAVHLDPERRAALWEALADGPAQVILTGTDPRRIRRPGRPSPTSADRRGRIAPNRCPNGPASPVL